MKPKNLFRAALILAFCALATSHAIAQQSAAPPPPPPPQQSESSAPKKPVAIGANIMATKRIDRTIPVYPADIHISGKVVLQITISEAGLVTDEAVVSSDSPMLISSAMEAVKQFRYAPTLLNGQPVAVATTVTIAYDARSSEMEPPPDAASSLDPSKPVAPGPGVVAAKRLDHTVPKYPKDARKAKVSGSVVVHAIITKEGRVTVLDVKSSDSPLLTQSAIDAVKKFRYSPTTVNGEPRDVDTTITVIFQLEGKTN